MSSKHPASRYIHLYCVPLVLFVCQAPAVSAPPRDILDTLKQKWDAQRTFATKTLRVEFLSNNRPPSRDFSEREIHELWHRFDLADEKRLDQFAKQIDTTLDLNEAGYSRCRLVVDGVDFKLDRTHAGYTNTTVRRASDIITIEPRNPPQVSIYSKNDWSGPKGYSPGDFRYLPHGDLSWDGHSVASLGDNRVRITSPDERLQVVADVETGFVYEYAARRATADGDCQAIVIFQTGRLNALNAATYPKVRMSCRFRNGLLESYRVQVIKSIKINGNIQAGELAVDAPGGINVFDFRPSRENPNYRRTERRYPDLMKAIDRGDFFEGA